MFKLGKRSVLLFCCCLSFSYFFPLVLSLFFPISSSDREKKLKKKMEVKNNLKFIYEIVNEYNTCWFREKYSFKETNTFYRILSARVTLRPSWNIVFCWQRLKNHRGGWTYTKKHQHDGRKWEEMVQVKSASRRWELWVHLFFTTFQPVHRPLVYKFWC